VRILAIEMSTGEGSLALVSGGTVEVAERFEAVRGQGSRLFPALAEIARTNTRIDVLLVGLGPGSYAGLRAAIAAAMGFGRAGGIPLAGLPSVFGVRGDRFRYLGDARRGALHHAVLEAGRLVEGPGLLDPGAARARVDADPALPLFGPAALPGFPGLEVRIPDAVQLAEAALRIGPGGWVPPPLEPLYLREASVTPPRVLGS
jgi:tRNA threonylcarbamoyladenosine biosynthesis protein TsaB